MVNDPGQKIDISAQKPGILAELIKAKNDWEAEVLAELPEEDLRLFPIGHPEYRFTQIPARDGIASGNIKRSNRYPNCSFFTNWTSTEDEINWNAEVLEDGDFEVIIYYTCPHEDIGSEFEVRFGSNAIHGQITDAHDPPLRGNKNDRSPRIESLVKDFKPLNLGKIHLEKGSGKLTLKAIKIPGSQVMDFRLMMFERI